MVTSIPFLIAKVADDSDFFKLKEMASVHDDWNLDYDKGGIRIWSKNVSDATVKMVKIRSTFSDINSSDLYNTLLDANYRKEWDPHMMISYDIGHFNPNNGVSYYAVSCPPPLRSRDFVLQSSWLDRGSEHFILNHSVCHKDHPPRKNFIRAISYFTGYFIQCSNISGCDMAFVSQTDPQGLIPTWLVNRCTQIFAPKFVKQLERAANKYSEWKKVNNPEFLPWIYPEQITSPKISLSDCVPCEEELNSTFFRYLVEKNLKSNIKKSESTSMSHARISSGQGLACKSQPSHKSIVGSRTSKSPTSRVEIINEEVDDVPSVAETEVKVKSKAKKPEKKESKEKSKEEKKKGHFYKKKGKRVPKEKSPSPELQEEELGEN